MNPAGHLIPKIHVFTGPGVLEAEFLVVQAKGRSIDRERGGVTQLGG
ncbi:MAG: hypothetical protein SynsKO_42730 [Synoicihabitans sp.]